MPPSAEMRLAVIGSLHISKGRQTIAKRLSTRYLRKASLLPLVI